MTYYTIAIRVPEGTGDWGSPYKTVFQGPAWLEDVKEACQRLKDAGHHVSVYRGKNLGKLVEDLSDE